MNDENKPSEGKCEYDFSIDSTTTVFCFPTRFTYSTYLTNAYTPSYQLIHRRFSTLHISCVAAGNGQARAILNDLGAAFLTNVSSIYVLGEGKCSVFLPSQLQLHKQQSVERIINLLFKTRQRPFFSY